MGQVWGKSFLAGWGAPDSLCYHAFGLIVTALSKKIGVSQPSSLKVVPISPTHCTLAAHASWPESFRDFAGPFEVIDMCAALDIEPIITRAGPPGR